MLLYLSNIGDVLAKSFKRLYKRFCLCNVQPTRKPSRETLQSKRSPTASCNSLPRPHTSLSSPTSPCTSIRENNIQHIGMRESPRKANSYLPNNISKEAAYMEQQCCSSDSSIDTSESHIQIPLSICLFIMVGYICGGAALFSRWEKWDFIESSYFCFVSLTTIGFGSLVPGKSLTSETGVQIAYLFCSLYLLIGMALIAMCFNLMQDKVLYFLRQIISCFGANPADTLPKPEPPS